MRVLSPQALAHWGLQRNTELVKGRREDWERISLLQRRLLAVTAAGDGNSSGDGSGSKQVGGKDGAGVLKDLDARTVAAKFAWYVEQYEKTYDIEEYAERLKAFALTLREIHHHEEDHKVGLNRFSDWTSDEFEAYQTYKPSPKRHAPQTHKTTGKPLPTEVDWRKEGLVADVKDQGSCGSCWLRAFLVLAHGHVFNGVCVAGSSSSIISGQTHAPAAAIIASVCKKDAKELDAMRC